MSDAQPSRLRRATPVGQAAVVLALVLLTMVRGVAPTARASDTPPVTTGSQPVSHSGEQPTTGLAVSIDALSPAYLTPGQPVAVRGVITNLDDHLWRDLQVYLVLSPSPMTSREQLAAALVSPATAYSGNRVTDAGLFLELGSLRPGATASYQLEVPFDQLGLLSRAPGVYSIGVHVIATDDNGVRNSAEATGRARSLIPLMPPEVDIPVALSLVWPFQARVQRTAEGMYANASELVGDVSSGGRLRRLLDVARGSGTVPLTLVTDPAVLDALQHLADGSSAQPASGADPGAATPTPPAEATAAQRSAQDFLRDFTTLTATQQIWNQGYGRPDLTSLAQQPVRGLMRSIDRATSTTLEQLELSGRSGYLPTHAIDPDALAKLSPETVALAWSEQIAGWSIEDGPVATLAASPAPVDVIVADRSLNDGGPTPGPTDTALQVRQRLLSETALLSLGAQLNGVDDPGAVFVASPGWDPGPSWPAADFFDGFDAPWLDMTPLDVLVDGGPFLPDQELAISEPVLRALPLQLLDSAALLQRRARIVRAVTDDNAQRQVFYDQAVALSVSEYWRGAPATAQALTDQLLSELASQLEGIVVEGPEFVTLSSSSGRFPITVTNTLDQPVSVGVRITADDGSMNFDAIGPVNLRGQESTTLTVKTRAGDIGVIGLTATLTTRNGRPFGQPATFSLRTSAVGVVVWLVLGVATGLVVLALARRLRRRHVERSLSPLARVRAAP